MSMLNSHGFAHAATPLASAAFGTGTISRLAAPGTVASLFTALSITLLVLTAIFALAAVRGLLPRGQKTRRRTP